MKKLELDSRDVKNLTKPDIYALLFVCYGKTADSKKSGKFNNKPDFVNRLT